MISKSDIILLLTEMQNDNIDTSNDISTVLSSQSIPLDILKKINDYRQLDLSRFYTKLRQSYNNKRSKLYINIVKADENLIDNPTTILTTASALLNQILQFDPEDKAMFYEHSRATDIIKALDIYFKTYNIEPIYKLLHAIKCDLKALEELQK